jgi:hypothetical protein
VCSLIGFQRKSTAFDAAPARPGIVDPSAFTAGCVRNLHLPQVFLGDTFNEGNSIFSGFCEQEGKRLEEVKIL